MFAYWFGWRFHSEILSLSWDQVDFSEGSVRLYPNTTKNNEGRIVYLEGEQLALFQQLFVQHQTIYPNCDLVFHRDGKPIKDFRVVWDRACGEAGLGGRIPHDFRRTAVRNLVRDGIGDTVAMKITGHKTRDVFGRYDIVSDSDLRRAARKVNARMVRETGTFSGTIADSQEGELLLKH
jgi:integrase